MSVNKLPSILHERRIHMRKHIDDLRGIVQSLLVTENYQGKEWKRLLSLNANKLTEITNSIEAQENEREISVTQREFPLGDRLGRVDKEIEDIQTQAATMINSLEVTRKELDKMKGIVEWYE